MLLDKREASAIVESMTQNSFLATNIGRAIKWCNQARINNALVDAVIKGKVRITHFNSSEPVFEYIEDEETTVDTAHVAAAPSDGNT
jgi:hypothetical protein